MDGRVRGGGRGGGTAGLGAGFGSRGGMGRVAVRAGCPAANAGGVDGTGFLLQTTVGTPLQTTNAAPPLPGGAASGPAEQPPYSEVFFFAAAFLAGALGLAAALPLAGSAAASAAGAALLAFG